MSLSNQVEEPERRIKEWLDQLNKHRFSKPMSMMEKTGENIKTQIQEAAYYLSLEKRSYNDLCWVLAEKLLKKTHPAPPIETIRKKADEIFALSKNYEELCWLNAEFDILTKRQK